LDVLRHAMRNTSRAQDRDAEVWMLAELPAFSSPSVISSHLLDKLLRAAQDSLSMGDVVTYEFLMRVFIVTAEPMWSMIGRWLRNGMPVQEAVDRGISNAYSGLDEEFFIEDNELMILDPDYWSDGFAIKTRDLDTAAELGPVPQFLQSASAHVLAAGKTVGLLRALGISDESITKDDSKQIEQWKPFSDVLDPSLRLYSVDDLSGLVYDILHPLCQTPQSKLADVIMNECDLWHHLSVIEDIYLMRRGDMMSAICDALFAKVRIAELFQCYEL
jgi:gamma-tubulin complex component 5